jgi:light-regulated signal transduction histidine kinase (bacteriophytochrome)
MEAIEELSDRFESTKMDLRIFSAAISHEIKAPVRAIDGYARIFMEDYGAKVDEEGMKLIRNIRNICDDTLSLINKLLEYEKLADIEPVREVIDFRLLIRNVFDELVAGYSDKKNIRLEFNGEIPSIIGDSILMRQVITNIIANSLKFTRNKECGLISVGYSFRNDEHIFYIKDNGAGFDMKFSQNLFGLFQRMHSMDEFEGSGVGLAIVKNIIRKSGGRVWITGEVGKGACVYFTIAQENILRYR